MVCLIKSKYLKELKEYADILGSESAAYYVLACNNGYTLKYDQQGNPSLLYSALLEINEYDEKAAILDKAMAFTPQFTDKYGKWYEGETEPSIIDMNDGNPLTNLSAIAELFGQESHFEESIAELQAENILERDIPLDQAIDTSRNLFVDSYIQQELELHPTLAAAELAILKTLARATFDREKLKEIIGKTQLELANRFGLIMNFTEDGIPYFTSPHQYTLQQKLDSVDKNTTLTEEEQITMCRINFVNSLSAQDYELPDGTVVKGVLKEDGTDEFTMHTIYISIMDGDATTMVHELAHHYIRQFWNTKLIQDGLRAFDPEHKLGARRAAEKLVDFITDKTLGKDATKNQVSWVKSFWQKFNNMLRLAIGMPLKDYSDKLTFLDIIAAYFSINADLSNQKTDQLFYELYGDTDFQSNTPADKQSTLTLNSIKDSIEFKIRAEKHKLLPNELLISKLQSIQKELNLRDPNNPNDTIESIVDMVSMCTDDMRETVRVISNIKLNGIENVDVAQLMDIKYNILGYYHKMFLQGAASIRQFAKNSNLTQLVQSSNLVSNVDTVQARLIWLENMFDDIMIEYIEHQIDVYADHLVDTGPVERFKANAKRWLHNEINDGNLQMFEKYLGAAVNSQSPIIRLVDYLLREANQEIQDSAQLKGHLLYDLYKKCRPTVSFSNFMKKFCEQVNGTTSGYFVRKENWGQMNSDIEDFKIKLYKKYRNKGVRVLHPETGEVIEPEDIVKNNTVDLNLDFSLATIDTYNDFNDELDDFYKGKIHRRYTPEYYKLRRRYLSQNTIQQLNDIQKRIDVLIRSTIDEDTKIPIMSKLSPENRAKLRQLERAKELLGSIYNVEYEDDGKTIKSFEKKTGDELRTALEIIEWHTAMRDDIKYSPNNAKFLIDRQTLVNKYGANSQEVLDFDYYFSARLISKAFWDQFGNNSTSDEIFKLRQRKSSILSTVFDKKGFYVPHLERLTDELWAELKKIDEEISQLSFNNTPQQNQNSIKFSDVASQELYKAYDLISGQLLNEYYLNILKNQANALALTLGQQAVLLFYNKYYYTNAYGELVPLSAFYYTVPNDPDFIVTNAVGQYLELDPSSSYYDDEFDVNVNSAIQPDEHYYHNDQWDYINSDKNIKAFYDELIKTMEEAYSMIPSYNTDDAKYRMPQVRDAAARLYFRKGGVWRHLKSIASDYWWLNERNLDYNEDFAVRPDGTTVSSVPVRWARLLDDPSSISTDVLMTVTMFYQMAKSYQKKSELQPKVEAVIFELGGGYTQKSEAATPDLVQRLKKYAEMYLYERRKTGFYSNDRAMNKAEVALSRTLDNIQQKAHAKLMAHNWRTVLKNLIDSGFNFFTELYGGKYMTFQDAWRANAVLLKDLPKALTAIGNPTSRFFKKSSSVIAAMQFNGLSGSVSEIFKGQRSSWLRRIYDKFFTMGEYTLVDFMFKGAIMVTTYKAHRLVYNPNTGKREFMNREQARYAYTQAGLKAKDGDKAWRKQKISLWEAYDVDSKGNWTLKKEYEDIVRPHVDSLNRKSRKLETRIAGTVKERSAYINGMLDDMDRAQFSLNYLGALFLLMRGWQVTHTWDFLKMGHDFALYQTNEELANTDPSIKSKLKHLYNQVDETRFFTRKKKGVKQESANKLKRVKDDLVGEEYRGMYNFATGQLEYGVWRDLFLNKFWQKLFNGVKNLFMLRRPGFNYTQNEIYHIRRMVFPILALGLVCAGSVFTGTMLEQHYKDDDKWFWDILYTVNIASVSERTGQIPFVNFLTLTELINSPFVVKGYIADIGYLLDLPLDATDFLAELYGWNDDPTYQDEVKQGAYKGMSKWQKDALKVWSVLIPEYSPDNIVRNLNGYGNSSSRNYYRNIWPTKAVTYNANLKSAGTSKKGRNSSRTSSRKSRPRN